MVNGGNGKSSCQFGPLPKGPTRTAQRGLGQPPYHSSTVGAAATSAHATRGHTGRLSYFGGWTASLRWHAFLFESGGMLGHPRSKVPAGTMELNDIHEWSSMVIWTGEQKGD